MELFIPSLLAILIAAGIVMFLLPRLSPVILGVLALIFLIAAAWHHYTFFGSEYQISTWQLPLVQYAPYLILGGLILFMIFFIVNFIGLSPSQAAAPVAAMNESVNKAANAAAEGVKNAINRVANMGNAGASTNQGAANRPANRGQGNFRFSQA